MKNIFLLPTDQPSRLVEDLNGVFSLMGESIEVGGPICNINIYITSDEEIKEGDWYLDTFNTQRIKANEFSDHKHYGNACKKIIFTTDFRLAPDVQKIDDEFLEWFVENPSCEFVEIKEVRQRCHLTLKNWVDEDENGEFPMSIAGAFSYRRIYKVIIPQEEPKQKLPTYDESLQYILNAHKVPKEYFGRQEESKPLDNLEERLKRDMGMIVIPLDNKNIPEEEGSMVTDWLDKYGDPKIEKQVEQEAKIMVEKETKPHSFCATPEEKCTMSYCDDNGCQNRKRNLVETKLYPIGGYAPGNYMCNCSTCKTQFIGDKRAVQCESCAVEMVKIFKKETLEEAAEEWLFESEEHDNQLSFIAGAKWQLENMPIHIYAENTYVHIEDGTIIVEKNDQTIISYSEDDLREAFKQSRQCKIFEKDMPPVYEEFEDWFKQFKKK